MSIDVIVPSRTGPLARCIEGIKDNTPPITSFFVMIDKGEGQTLIRYNGAKSSVADYILLLDDDVYMPSGLVQKYLKKIEEGYDAVCGNTEPKPNGSFGKYVVQYMTNPSTPFYPVGCTLWRRQKFIQIMDEIGLNINKDLGDNLLGKQVRDGNYKVVRVEDAICDHITYVTATNFFRKRVKYGVAIGELFIKEKKFLKMYLKFFFGIPLSRGRGTFVYRLATFIGMTKYLLGYRK